MILQALFLSTLNKPKNIPRIQAKNRPHKARSRVCPIARSSRFPYLVMIWIMENSFQKQSCLKMQQPCNSCNIYSDYSAASSVGTASSPRYLAMISLYSPLSFLSSVIDAPAIIPSACPVWHAAIEASHPRLLSSYSKP